MILLTTLIIGVNSYLLYVIINPEKF
ncbi:MAG: potassium-transporting ATPase subunit F [Proteocatella sp.]